ncbi:hypothetical protein SAMN04487943_104272 [Gracilibacillus orientalis]|uniref:Uncharacterized protein n=1 Tax=Gracilibacillus orientalis TaxID=334253 RepID=A0A1I4L098_9BACI|nr:hypothetical protein [Gracilibacillus orientalis]SFL84455.1 hypothetical protein SAMN04487943_104272 [Gracilibacillus orientalis]
MHLNQRDDQAASLRNQVEQQQTTQDDTDSLPPRNEVHQNSKTKVKWKISFPFIRFILILLIVIILLLLTVKLWGEHQAERTDNLFSISDLHYGNTNFAYHIVEDNPIDVETIID